MITVLSRIIHYGLKQFARNGLLSAATVAIVTLCLLVFGGLIVANAFTGATVEFLKDKIDVSVYFKTTAPEDEILRIKSSLEELQEVRAVEYISADRALEIFREKHQDDPTIVQSLEELSENPLEPSLNIKAHDPEKYATIAEYLGSPRLAEYVSSVGYARNQVVIDRLIAVVSGVNRTGLIITILLSLIAALVVFNTIRLAIYSNRDEIGIMRAVGASNALVRGPYVVWGGIIGAIAAILSLILVLIFLALAPLAYGGGDSFLDLSIPGFSVRSYLSGNFFALLGWQLLFGVVLSGASSFMAVRKYLTR